MPLTIHERIVQDLRDRIGTGRLRPGEAIPSSRVLAEQWNCARGTATDALRALAREGLIVDRKGLGYFVIETPVARPAGHRAAGTARIEGALPFKIVGRPGYITPSPRVAAALGLVDGVEALARTRLLFRPSGEPVTLVTAWFRRELAECCELLHGTAPIPGGTTRHIIARTGRRPVAGRDVLSVRLADEFEREILGLVAPAPVQIVIHTARDASGFVVVAEEGVTSGEYAEHVDEYSMES